MGKSPGKWIKTLLFGKKTSKSNLSKGRDVSRAANETWVAAKAPGADLAVDPPLISHLAPGPTDKKEGNSEKGVPSNLSHDDDVLPGNQDIEGTAGSDAPNDPERIRQEQAATKAQAAFRGYLARRAFRALKGIIRLQALVRGHLVRRQAVATLRCMQGIVKLQALVRGRRVRLSDTGLELRNKFSLRKPLEAKSLELIQVNIYTRSEKLSANAFVRKLLASSSVTMPLHLQYGPGEPNSAWNWLERWTSSRFWEPLSQAKTVTGSKSQVKKGNLQTAETKPGRPKRSVRRVPAANIDNGLINSTSESEKPKRNIRKVTSHPVDSVQENPQNELEKVKRSLRKVSSTTVESSDRLDVENEKLKRTLGKVSISQAPDISDQAMGDSAEKMKKDTTEAVSSQPDIETTPKPLTAEDPVDDSAGNHSAIELQPLESSVKEENISVTNGELSSKEDQASNENQKIGRRRASLPAKQEYPENGLQNTPKLPSYMSSTESAKAKFRGQGSPRFAQDVVEKNAEKNGFTRRHSLPSSTNGKLSSLSPRTQRLAQASGKGGIRDRSLLSSRDGNDKVVQAEWRR